jgi:hypothetical protein
LGTTGEGTLLTASFWHVLFLCDYFPIKIKPVSSKEVSKDYMMEYDMETNMAYMGAIHSSYPQHKGNRGFQFPWKLHEMLAVAKQEGKESIVSWQPHGRAFRVHNRELFSTMIMPRFFKQTKYKSFQRQLHLWDFKRIAQGEDGGAYFHQYFLLGQPDQCKLMCRTKIKGTQMQAEDIQGPSMDFPDTQL